MNKKFLIAAIAMIFVVAQSQKLHRYVLEVEITPESDEVKTEGLPKRECIKKSNSSQDGTILGDNFTYSTYC